MGFQEMSPLLDLLSGDARIGLSLVNPTGMESQPSRESMVKREHVQLDVVGGEISCCGAAQPFPSFHAIQQLLDLVDLVFCHACTVCDVVDMFRKRLALVLELLKLNGGDELQGLAERGGTSATKR